MCLGILINVETDNASGPSLDDKGFQNLFDGKTLAGWKVTPLKAKDDWTVKEGVIVGKGGKFRSYLEYQKKDIADFELKFEYRFKTAGNSGVNIRAIPDPTGKRGFQAYHADLGHVGIGKNILGAWDFHTPGRKEHGCFRGDRLVIDSEDKPTIAKIKDPIQLSEIKKRDWNRVHLIVRDNRFQFWINGKLSAEFTEHLPQQKRLHRGAIQLQLHDPEMVVEFRQIKLKLLKKD